MLERRAASRVADNSQTEESKIICMEKHLGLGSLCFGSRILSLDSSMKFFPALKDHETFHMVP